MPPDETVWISHRGGDKCARCGGALEKGMMVAIDRERGVRCLKCAELDRLVFLPSGDAALTRRASKGSSTRAVVLKFSNARNRHERQGTLVEPEALAAAKSQCEADADKRKDRRLDERVRRAAADGEYVREFAVAILSRFPKCPPEEASEIARHACRKYSGRIGRTRSAKEFGQVAIELAVRAHVRHARTSYDALLEKGMEVSEARGEVREKIEKGLRSWGAS